MAMFIALILVLLVGIIALITAENGGVIKAAIAIAVSTALLTGAAALIGGLVAPLTIGVIISIMGVLVTYDDIKDKRFPDMGIFGTSLGLIFLGMTVYLYCIQP